MPKSEVFRHVQIGQPAASTEIRSEKDYSHNQRLACRRGPLDDCDRELETQLVSFIDEICVGTAPVELIINGDFWILLRRRRGAAVSLSHARARNPTMLY